MLDNLREQSGDDFFIEDQDDEFPDDDVSSSSESAQFLGMTPVQRFVIAVMVLLIVAVIGTFFLLVTGKLYLPIF